MDERVFLNRHKVVSILKENGPVTLRKLKEITGLSLKQVQRVYRSAPEDFDYIKLNIGSCMGSALSHWDLINIHPSERVILLKDDIRIIQFIADRITKPYTYDKIWSVRTRLSSIIGTEKAWAVAKACGIWLDRVR